MAWKANLMMNRVFRTSEHPFEEIEFVAVGVDPDGSHVGILYRPEPDDDNSRVHFLHL